ncbi:MAG: lytic transglycosylase domain-containing protein [Polyangiaceae bacterium]
MRLPTSLPIRPHALLLLVCSVLSGLPLSASGAIVRSVDSQGVITIGQSNRTSRRTTDVTGSRSASTNPATTTNPAPTSVSAGGRYDEYISQAARLYQIPEELVRAVIQVESGYMARAVSKANAKGLMQLIPATAQRMQVEDVFDPRQNIFGGTRYLRILANLFNGDLTLTIAAYNAGEAAVMRYGGVPPYRETEDYVTRVVSLYRKYRAEKS